MQTKLFNQQPITYSNESYLDEALELFTAINDDITITSMEGLFTELRVSLNEALANISGRLSQIISIERNGIESSLSTSKERALSKKVDSKLKMVQFVPFSKRLMSVPDNFGGNMLSYVADLQDYSNNFKVNYSKLMNSFKSTLNVALANEQFSLHYRSPLTSLQNHEEKLKSKLDEYFTGNGAFIPIRHGYNSIGEMSDVFRKVSNEVAIVDPDFIKLVKTDIDVAAGILSTLGADLSTETNANTKKKIKTLAGDAYGVAVLANTLAIRAYDYRTATESVRKMRETILKEF
jgi:hypothetical protein